MAKPPPGPPPTDIVELARAEDRVSFLYLERCTVHRDENAITVTDERGVVHVPAAALGSVLLGPGSRVTHQAMMLIAESGSTAVWVGERGVRYYAHGRTLTNSSRLVEAQARLVSNQSSRLAVARRMYAMRFEGEDVSRLTMQQLRGREGARVRDAYRREADRAGIDWRRRDYVKDDFTASNDINQAISAATSCLYGAVHSVIVALGASPALGFVHTGNARSFVFDVADLYKMELAVPVAFSVTATSESEDIPGEVRRKMRDAIHESKLLSRCARDLRRLLLEDEAEGLETTADELHLWDDRRGRVAGGKDYAEDDVPW
jgi:CRISPR-associated protein Cas1